MRVSGLAGSGVVWRYLQAFPRLGGAIERGIGAVWSGVEAFGGISKHFYDLAEHSRGVLGRCGVAWRRLAVVSSILTTWRSN